MIKARMGRVDAVKTNADIFPKSPEKISKKKAKLTLDDRSTKNGVNNNFLSANVSQNKVDLFVNESISIAN